MKVRDWLVGVAIVFLMAAFIFMVMKLDKISVSSASVETSMADLEETTNQRLQPIGTQVTALRADIEKLKTDLATLQQRLSDVSTTTQISDLKGSVDMLQSAVAPLGDEFTNLKSILAEISQQIEKLLAQMTPSEETHSASNADGKSCVSAFSWSDAASYAGQAGLIFIKGPVVTTSHAGDSPVILNVGADANDSHRLRVLISPENLVRFTSPPEEYYLGKTICVSGVINLINDEPSEEVAEMEISAPEYITVVAK